MDSKRWNIIEPILDKALELPKKDRLAFIKQSCKKDSKSFHEAVKLLTAIHRSKKEHFLDKISIKRSDPNKGPRSSDDA